MACLPLPTPPPLPTLPGGISLTPTLPTPSLDPALCCKTVDLPIGPSLIPLPPGIFNPAAAAAISEVLAAATEYKDAIPLRCPKE
jgi:hypothetical protein